MADIGYGYRDIGKRSAESEVNGFWNSILSLPQYFPTEDGFVIYPQKQSDPESQEKSDLIVRYNRDNHTMYEIDPRRTVMVWEDKKRDCAFGRGYWWKYGLNQLTGYMHDHYRTEFLEGLLFGAVGIGRYVRFYYLDSSGGELQDYYGDPDVRGREGIRLNEDNEPWEVKDGEEAIHQILLDIRRHIQRVG